MSRQCKILPRRCKFHVGVTKHGCLLFPTFLNSKVLRSLGKKRKFQEGHFLVRCSPSQQESHLLWNPMLLWQGPALLPVSSMSTSPFLGGALCTPAELARFWWKTCAPLRANSDLWTHAAPWVRMGFWAPGTEVLMTMNWRISRLQA